MDEWMSRSGNTNRNEAIEAINSGQMNGFVAFDQEKCVGWVNAACILNYPRLLSHIDSSLKDEKTALTICFVIDEAYRGLKISSMLLDAAILFFKTNGYERMIALPVHNDVKEKMYRGIKQMYLNRGYIELSSENGLSVLLLNL
jgi:GNAT superfamily N-acetyltransferase